MPKCPPEMEGPHRRGAVCLLPITAPRIVPELRAFVAQNYPARPWMVASGNVLFVLAIGLFCGMILYDGAKAGTWGVLRSGIVGILPTIVPLVLVYRGFLFARRGANDAGIPTVAVLRNQVVRPDAATMLVDLYVVGINFRRFVAIMQDPYLVLGRYHRRLLFEAVPFCVAWFLTFLAMSTRGGLDFYGVLDVALFLLLYLSGRSIVIAVLALGVAENLREMLGWLIVSSSEGRVDAAWRLRRLLWRATLLTVLPLLNVAVLLVIEYALETYGVPFDSRLLYALAATVVFVFQRPINLIARRWVLNDLRRVLREGERVLADAVSRLAARTS